MDTLIKTIILRMRKSRSAYQAISSDGLVLIVGQDFRVPALVEARVLRFWAYNGVAYAQAEVTNVRSFRTVEELLAEEQYA